MKPEQSSPATQPSHKDPHEEALEAIEIFETAEDPQGTPVETYLLSRGVLLPPGAAGEAVRFHRACPFGTGHHTPAMVCLLRHVLTNEPQAIHLTALTPDGHRVVLSGQVQMSLGPLSLGAIKLTPDEDVTLCLGVGESIESTLSLRNFPEFGPSPVWTIPSASGLERLPVLPGVETLWVAVDHNPTGLRAARRIAERWRAAGREMILITPRVTGADLNDLLLGARHAAA